MSDLSASDDLDTLFNQGFYYWDSAGRRPANAPNLQYAALLVFQRGPVQEGSVSNMAYQFAFAAGPALYYRAYTGNPRKWSDWKSVSFT